MWGERNEGCSKVPCPSVSSSPACRNRTEQPTAWHPHSWACPWLTQVLCARGAVEGTGLQGRGHVPGARSRDKQLVWSLPRATPSSPTPFPHPGASTQLQAMKGPHLAHLSLIKNATNHLSEEASKRGCLPEATAVSYFSTCTENLLLEENQDSETPFTAGGRQAGTVARASLRSPWSREG